MGAGWIAQGADTPAPATDADPWKPVGPDTSSAPALVRPHQEPGAHPVDTTRGLFTRAKDVLFGHEPESARDADQAHVPGVLPAIGEGIKSAYHAGSVEELSKGPELSTLATAYPHLVGAEFGKVKAGLEEGYGTAQVQKAERTLAALNVLPQVAARTKAGDLDPIVAMSKDPLVDKTARSLGLSPQEFAADWGKYQGFSHEEQADMAAHAQETLAKGKANLTAGENTRLNSWAEERAWQPADLKNGKLDPWSLKGVAFNAALAAPQLAAVTGAALAGGAVAGPGGALVGGAAAGAAIFAPAQRSDAKNQIDGQVSRLLEKADALDEAAPVGGKRGLNPVTEQIRQQAADLSANSDRIANTAGFLYAVGDAAGALPLSAVLARTPGAKSVMDRIVGSAIAKTSLGRMSSTIVANGAGGAVQAALQKAVDTGIVHENQSLADALKDVAYAGVVGAVTAAPIAAVHEAAGAPERARIKRDLEADELAARVKAAADNLNGNGAAGPTPSADTYPGYRYNEGTQRYEPTGSNEGAGGGARRAQLAPPAAGGGRGSEGAGAGSDAGPGPTPRGGAGNGMGAAGGADAGGQAAPEGAASAQAKRQAYQSKVDALNTAAAAAEKRSDVTLEPEEEGWSVHVKGQPVARFETAEAARAAMAQARKVVGTKPAEPETEAAPGATKAPDRATNGPKGETELERTQEIPTERRTRPELRQRVEQMTPEQLRAALLTHELSGLPNRRAYEESPKKPAQVSVDVDSLKWLNDNASHDAGDQLLKAVGKALHEETGGNAYHISGDEFVVQGDNPEHAEGLMAKAKARLANAELTFAHPDGRTVTLNGIGLSHGTGSTLEEAEGHLHAAKSGREAAGLRAARGEQPPNARISADQAGLPAGGSEAAAPQVAAKPSRAAELAKEIARGIGTGTPKPPINPHAEVLGQKVERPAEPTPKQMRAGNYFKPTTTWNGIPIKVENLKGSKRPYIDAVTGKPGVRTMKADYGYVHRTEGADGDAVDIMMGPHHQSEKAYVIDQLDGAGSKFDEHKIQVGVRNEAEARRQYLSHYPKDWKGLGAITPMSVDQLKQWIDHGDLKKPVAWKPSTRQLLEDPAVRDRLEQMGHEAGWAEIGGRMIRKEVNLHGRGNEYEISRTKWIPKEPWFAEQGERLGKGDRDYHAVIADALAGKKLNAKERRIVGEMAEHAAAHVAEHKAKGAGLGPLSDQELEGLSDDEMQQRLDALQAEQDRLERELEREGMNEPAETEEDLDHIPFSRKHPPGVAEEFKLYSPGGTAGKQEKAKPKGQATQQDLFGEHAAVQNEIGRLRAARDRKRNEGQTSSETGRSDDLFSQAQKQTDLTDQPKPKPLAFAVDSVPEPPSTKLQDERTAKEAEALGVAARGASYLLTQMRGAARLSYKSEGFDWDDRNTRAAIDRFIRSEPGVKGKSEKARFQWMAGQLKKEMDDAITRGRLLGAPVDDPRWSWSDLRKAFAGVDEPKTFFRAIEALRDAFYQVKAELLYKPPVPQAALPGMETRGAEHETRRKAIDAQLFRFASGMSRPKDIEAGSFGTRGTGKLGLGVDVGELSKTGIKTLAREVAHGAQAFVDSGAFSLFRKQMKTEGKVAPLDFDAVLAKYDELMNEIHEADAAEEGKGELLMVMPDVVGDQAASLQLLHEHGDWIEGGMAGGRFRLIIPIQKGALSLTQAYKQILDTLGANTGTKRFILGIPANEAAVTTADLKEFLATAEPKPREIHFLGAVSDSTLEPKLNALADSGLLLRHLSADGNLLRSQLYGKQPAGTSRTEAVSSTLQDLAAKMGSQPAIDTAAITESLKNTAAQRNAEAKTRAAQVRNDLLEGTTAEKLQKLERELTEVEAERQRQYHLFTRTANGKPVDPAVMRRLVEIEDQIVALKTDTLAPPARTTTYYRISDVHLGLRNSDKDPADRMAWIARRDDGTATAYLDNGKYGDITESLAAGKTPEQALAFLFGSDRTGANVKEIPEPKRDSAVRHREQAEDQRHAQRAKARAELSASRDVPTRRELTQDQLPLGAGGRPLVKAAAPAATGALEDAGEKIGGARKDKWAERGMRLSDLSSMSEAEAATLVNKKAVWNPNWKELIAGGMPQDVAAVAKVLIDQLAAKPRYNTPEGRRHYVEILGRVRDMILEAKDVRGLRAIEDRLATELGMPRGYSLAATPEQKLAREKFWSIQKGRRSTLRVMGSDERKALALLATGWPEKKAVETTDDGTPKPPPGPEEPKRPHLDEINRIGPPVRAHDVSSTDFIKAFGFRGLEFGNWAANDERQRLMNHAYEGLQDLARILQLPPQALSLNGTMGLALGARGGGRFAAHYESGKLVINMTKINGAGALAHEWGHALDHYMGELGRSDAYTTGARGATGWHDDRRSLGHLRPEMQAAWEGVMQAMYKRTIGAAEFIRDGELSLEKMRDRLKGIDEREKASPGTYPGQREFVEDQITALERRLAAAKTDPAGTFGNRPTDYIRQSAKLGEYWRRPTEMWARAFESFVFDKIAAEGHQSDYLVQGVEGERYADPKYKGNPYPAEDRPAINAAIQKLVDTLETHGERHAIREGETRYSVEEARKPRAKKVDPNAPQQLDIIANGAAPGPAVQAARLASTVKLTHVGAFRTGIKAVKTWADAAHVFAPWRKNPQEHMGALVLGERGKPLAIIRHTIGVSDGANVEPWSLAGAIASVPGAKSVYFGHNHPSGVVDQSEADHRITDKLHDLLRGTGIEPKGMIVVAPGNLSATHYAPPERRSEGGEQHGAMTLVARTGAAVPVFDRRIAVVKRNIGPLTFASASNPMSAKTLVKLSGEPSGALLLNKRHQAVGVVPMSTAEMAKLRTGNAEHGAGRLLKAMAEVNASAVIAFGDHAAARNVAMFTNASGGRALDVMYRNEHGELVSDAETGQVPQDQAYLKRGPGRTGGGMQVEDVRAVVSRMLKGFSVKPQVTVVDTLSDLADHPEVGHIVRDAGNAAAIAFVHPRTNKIYLIADQLESPEAAASALAHEYITHFGLRAALGDRRNAEYQAILEGVAKAMPAELRAQGEREFPGSFNPLKRHHRNIAAEEVLAYYGQQYARGQSVPERIRRWLDKLAAMIRDWVRQVLGLPQKFDELFVKRTLADLESFLRRGRTQARAGGTEGEPAFAEPKDTFFSGLARAVDAAKRDKGTGAEWEATLRNMPGVKAEELQWTGLKEWLEGRGRVSKAEVAEFVHAHRVEVGEHIRGASETPPFSDLSISRIDKWLEGNGVYGIPLDGEQAAALRRGGQVADDVIEHLNSVLQVPVELLSPPVASRSDLSDLADQYEYTVVDQGSDQVAVEPWSTLEEDVKPTDTAAAPFLAEWNALKAQLEANPAPSASRDMAEARMDALHREMVKATIAERQASRPPTVPDELAEAVERYNAAVRNRAKPTKYQQYTTPGGSGYRELLLTLPRRGLSLEQRETLGRLKQAVVRAETAHRESEKNAWEVADLARHKLSPRTFFQMLMGVSSENHAFATATAVDVSKMVESHSAEWQPGVRHAANAAIETGRQLRMARNAVVDFDHGQADYGDIDMLTQRLQRYKARADAAAQDLDVSIRRLFALMPEVSQLDRANGGLYIGQLYRRGHEDAISDLAWLESLLQKHGLTKDHPAFKEAIKASRTYGQASQERDALSERITRARNSQEVQTHWEEPNVIAHARFDERTGPEGERTLHIHEIQSDWHQKGRKYGYVGDHAVDQAALLHERQVAHQEAVQALKESDYLGFDDAQSALSGVFREGANWVRAWPDVSPEGRTAIERWRRAAAAVIGGDVDKTNQVPDAPFKTTWPELTMKRMLRYAAERGFDAISWDTGKTQAARYNLSHQIDSLKVWHDDVIGEDGSPTFHFEATKDNRVVARDPNGPLGDGIPRSTLADHIGHELAASAAEKLARGEEATYTGEDMNIGGGGMKAFYDKMLPAAVGKLVKRFGGKVESAQIPGEFGEAQYFGPEITSPAEVLGKVRLEMPVVVREQLRDIAGMIGGGSTTKVAVEAVGSPAAAEALGGELVEPRHGVPRIRRWLEYYASEHGLKLEDVPYGSGQVKLDRSANSYAIIPPEVLARVDQHNALVAGMHQAVPIHKVRITPALRDSVMGGQPMFLKRRKGSSGTEPPAPKRGAYDLARRSVAAIPKSELSLSLRRIVDPAGVSDVAGATAIKFRESLGSLAQEREAAVHELEQYAKQFDLLSTQDRYDFIDDMEEGRPQRSPELQDAADTIRSLLDDWRERIRGLGIGALDNFIENYFPHIWQNDQDAKTWLGKIFGRRPLKGPASFLKERTIPTTREGLEAGLKPVSTNPLILSFAKLAEMMKFYHGVQFMQGLKDDKLAVFKPAFKRMPEGWVKIEDAVGRVLQWSDEEQGFIERGHYIMPADAGRVVNNHLGASALRNFLPAQLFRVVSNAANALQLGFSGFHLGFTTLDAIISRNAIGIERLLQGEPLKAAQAFLEAATGPGAALANIARGHALRRAYKDPESAAPAMRRLVDALRASGGRIKMDRYFQAAQGISPFHGVGFVSLAKDIRTALTQPSGKVAAAAKVLGSFPLEYATKLWRDLEASWHEMPMPVLTVPIEMAGRVTRASTSIIMEHIVPLQKLGVFSDLAADHIRRNPDEDPIAFDAAMQSIWNSVDNRLGEMVYDNLFWNRTFKDVNHMMIRAVGWNLGTVRELGGAPIDVIKVLDYMARGAPPEAQGAPLEQGAKARADYEAQKSRLQRIAEKVGHKIPYTLALVGTTMVVGAIMQYLFTGSGPEEAKDYFFPRTGRKTKQGTPERISLPSYMKDIYEYSTQPMTTVINKANPIFGIIHAIYANEDFFGDPVRDPDAGTWRQLIQGAQYAAREVLPFSLQGTKQFAGAGNTDAKGQVLEKMPYFGLTPAPARVTSPEQMDRYQLRETEKRYLRGLQRKLRTALGANDMAEVQRLREEIRDHKAAEKATERQIRGDKVKAREPAATDHAEKISQLIEGKGREEAADILHGAGYPAFAELWRSLPERPRARVASSLEEFANGTVAPGRAA